MDIRLGAVQPDSDHYSDTTSKKRRIQAKRPHDEEIWSERSDYEEIEDTYTPSSPEDEENG